MDPEEMTLTGPFCVDTDAAEEGAGTERRCRAEKCSGPPFISLLRRSGRDLAVGIMRAVGQRTRGISLPSTPCPPWTGCPAACPV